MAQPGIGMRRIAKAASIAAVLWVAAGGLLLQNIPLWAEGPAVLKVAEFSRMSVDSGLPTGWRQLTFEKIPAHTKYRLVRDGDRTVVMAESSAGASGLTKAVRIDLAVYPIIHWEWKVENVVRGSDVTKKSGDDYAARIYITFEYDPERVDFLKKARYQAGRLLFGDIPIAAINYIWESKAPIGTLVENAYTDFVRMIVVESGEEKVGQWVKETRNLYEDYRAAFGEEPPRVNGVAIMTDTDNTGGSAVAYYGDIWFERPPP